MMNRHHILIAAALMLMLPALVWGAGNDQTSQTFVVKTLSPLSASKNKKGDRFTVQVMEPASHKGAIIEGVVKKAKAAGRVKGKSELLFDFDTLVPSGQESVPITADLASVKNSQGVEGVDEEGRVIGKSSRKQDVTRTAVATGIGALIGGIAGGGSGAAKGAAIGAAVGLTIAFSTRGEDIYFAPGSIFYLQVVENKKQK